MRRPSFSITNLTPSPRSTTFGAMAWRRTLTHLRRDGAATDASLTHGPQALDTVARVTGLVLDDRPLRAELDFGFRDGRQCVRRPFQPKHSPVTIQSLLHTRRVLR